MCPDLEQRRFGVSRGASTLPTAATGPSEAAMGNHMGESPQEVAIVRTPAREPTENMTISLTPFRGDEVAIGGAAGTEEVVVRKRRGGGRLASDPCW
jgi:hypothetical protein